MPTTSKLTPAGFFAPEKCWPTSCQVRSWFWPTLAKGPDRPSIRAILTVSPFWANAPEAAAAMTPAATSLSASFIGTDLLQSCFRGRDERTSFAGQTHEGMPGTSLSTLSQRRLRPFRTLGAQTYSAAPEAGFRLLPPATDPCAYMRFLRAADAPRLPADRPLLRHLLRRQRRRRGGGPVRDRAPGGGRLRRGRRCRSGCGAPRYRGRLRRDSAADHRAPRHAQEGPHAALGHLRAGHDPGRLDRLLPQPRLHHVEAERGLLGDGAGAHGQPAARQEPAAYPGRQAASSARSGLAAPRLGLDPVPD